MPRKILLSRRDWVQDVGATFSNGSWFMEAPLRNLKDPRPQFIARADDNTSLTSTKFDVNLGAERKIGIIFFANIVTTSLDAMIRVRLSNSATIATNVYDSGIVPVRPIDSTPGGTDHWGNATSTGYMQEDEWISLGRCRFFIPVSIVSARYARVEIDDGDVAGSLEIGCFGLCEAWESPIDFAPAPSISFIDDSEIFKINYGSTFALRRGIRRRMNFGFPALESDEVLNRTLGLALIKGKSQPIVAVAYPDDEANLEKTSIYGLISQDNVISNPFFGHYSQPFQIDQLI